jgi:prepilin-type N-terminal cleavage/methylation domain-containing protein
VRGLRNMRKSASSKRQKGFSLLELLVSVAILVIVAGAIIMAMIRMTWSQSTIMNRTQMHSSVRNATELMQQEVGQAGKLGSSPGLTFTSAIAGGGASATPGISSTSGTATTGLYVGEQLVVDPSSTNEETVTITAVNSGSIQAKFANAHPANVPVLVMGGIVSGVVPPDTSSMLVLKGNATANTPLSGARPSTASVLKLYGDLNGDGTMYYVAYKCDQANGTLYRYVSTDVTGANTVSGALLLDNLGQNPNNAPCFTYTTKDAPVTISGGQVTETFVINVAVTLTVNTQNRDLQTRAVQTETKALLNIAPRNVFEAWQLASSPSGYSRAQPMPTNVYDNLLSVTLPH